MAFAPPRKTKKTLPDVSAVAAAAAAPPVKTRIPLLSPVKKSTVTNGASAQPRELTALTGSRSIPSRYLQASGSAAPQKAVPGDKGAPRRHVVGTAAKTNTGSFGETAPVSTERPRSAKVAQSPSKSRTGVSSSNTVDEDDLRDRLTVRIAHTLVTCDRGEDAFAQLRESAEARLALRWERAKQVDLQTQSARMHGRLQKDLTELETLGTDEIVLLEGFVERVDTLRAEMDRLSHEIGLWTSESLLDAPRPEWLGRLQAVTDACDAARITMQPVSGRLVSLGSGAIVSTTLHDLLDILGLVREEAILQGEHCRLAWRRRCREVDAAYEAVSMTIRPDPLAELSAYMK